MTDSHTPDAGKDARHVARMQRKKEVVDAANLHASLHVLVEGLYQARREETVVLSSVHVDALISLLCGAAVFVLPRAALLLVARLFVVAFGFPVARLALFVVDGFGRVLVVFKQTVEFKRHDAFQQVVFRQPFQLFHDSRQIFCNFVLVHLYAFYAVGKVV